MKLAQEVFGGEAAQKMLQEESVRKDAVVNTSLLMTSPQKDVNELVENIIADVYERFEEIPAREIEKYYIGIANTRNEALLSDPVQFIRSY
jgi:GTPase SAR1 family protein